MIDFVYNNSYQAAFGITLLKYYKSTYHLYIEMRWVKKNIWDQIWEIIEVWEKIWHKAYKNIMFIIWGDFEIWDRKYSIIWGGTNENNHEVKKERQQWGPYKILDKANGVTYRLVLSLILAKVYNEFYASMWRNYILDLSHVIKK